MLDLIYALLFAAAIASAVLVVLVRNTVYCALALVVTMLSLAGIFLVIHAPFVALIQLFVYAGAIMVLFVYVVMLLNPRHTDPIPQSVRGRRGVAVLLASVFFLLTTAWVVRIFTGSRIGFQFRLAEVKPMVAKMLNYYLLPFELTSVLLLIAIVGAILIARRN